MPVFPTKHFNTGNPNLDNQLRRMARAVQTAHPAGTGTTRISRTPTGTLQRFSGSRRRMPLVVGSGGGNAGFSGYGWVKGTFFDLRAQTAKAWVRIQLDTGQVTYNDGPPPTGPGGGFPAFETWREMATWPGGPIYID
jgi:hypothetical protein